MDFRLTMAAVAATMSFGIAATPASAAVTLLEPACDLYSAQGCLFSHGGGGEFDDADLIKAAYDLTHLAAPPPENLPADFAFLGKTGEGGIVFDDNGASYTFTNLPFEVSFYSIKTGETQIILFGLNPATDTFTATNTRIFNDNGQARDISHVTFYGGGDTAIPEPATWAMMIIGFGAAGSMLRSNRRKMALAAI